MFKFLQKSVIACALALPLFFSNAHALENSSAVFLNNPVQLVAALDVQNTKATSSSTEANRHVFTKGRAGADEEMSFSSVIWIFGVALFAFVSLSNRNKV
jgi:hypothetical protein